VIVKVKKVASDLTERHACHCLLVYFKGALNTSVTLFNSCVFHGANLTPDKEDKLKYFEDKFPRKMCGPLRYEQPGKFRKLYEKELCYSYFSLCCWAN